MQREKPWRNKRVLGTLFFVFLAGGAFGALSMNLGLHDRLHRTAAASTKRPDTTKDAVIQRFRSELDISQAQADQIAMVLEDYRQYYQSLQEQMEDIRSTGNNRIVEILTPEQRQKFEKMKNELAPQFQSTK